MTNRLLKDIGTIEWCRRTRGLLDPSERRRFIAAIARQFARSIPRVLAYRAGFRGRGPDPASFEIPDTELTRAVLDACRHLEPEIVRHGYRSYLFARALGKLEGLHCDAEALFVAAILHDYAFAVMDTIEDRCFTLAGADVAAELLGASQLSAALQHEVLDAITLHANPYVTPEQGTLQYLLHDGVFIDVLGFRAWDLDPQGLSRVCARYPRTQYFARGVPILRGHARRVPRSRTGVGFACGLELAIGLGPWRSYEARLRADAALEQGAAQ